MTKSSSEKEIGHSSSSLHLNRSHGFFNTLNLFFGMIIGSGIFISVNQVAKETPNAGCAILMWFGLGLFSILGSFCFAELGTCFPESGGDFLYLKVLMPKKYGDLVAFLRIFLELLVIRPGSQAAIALTVSKYIIMPFIGLDFGDNVTETVANTTVTVASKLANTTAIVAAEASVDSQTAWLTISMEVGAAIFLTLLFTYINAYSINLTKILCDALSVLKVVVLIGLVCLGLYTIGTGNRKGLVWGSQEDEMWYIPPNWATMTGMAVISKLVMASYGGQWSYAGWSDINYAMEEIIEPAKNYPKAAFISMLTITILYTGIVVGFYSVLTHPDITNGIAATTIIFVERAFGYESANTIIRIFIAVVVSLSTAGALHSSLFASARLFFAGARFNHMPAIFGGLHKEHQTPVPSLFIICSLSILYCLFPFFSDTAIDFLINSTCFVYFLAIAICVGLLVIWRIRGRPNVGSVLCTPTTTDANTKIVAEQETFLEPEQKLQPKMTLDEVFTMPLFWHILYCLISLFLTLFALFAEPVQSGYGLLVTALGIPVYYWFVFNKSNYNSHGEIIPNEGGEITARLLDFLNCKLEKNKELNEGSE